MADKTPKKPAVPIPEKPKDRGGTQKTDIIAAPLDLGDDVVVGEGTVKQAYVPTDLAAARRQVQESRGKVVGEDTDK